VLTEPTPEQVKDLLQQLKAISSEIMGVIQE